MAAKKAVKPKYDKPGQPTKYKPEYCQMLIDHCKVGNSFETFGATIGVSRDNVYEWAKQFPEFSEAKSTALDMAQLFYEQEGSKGMLGKTRNFNSTVWVFNMKNRFKWHDNIQVTQDVKVEKVDNTQELAKKLTEIIKTANEIK